MSPRCHPTPPSPFCGTAPCTRMGTRETGTLTSELCREGAEQRQNTTAGLIPTPRAHGDHSSTPAPPPPHPPSPQSRRHHVKPVRGCLTGHPTPSPVQPPGNAPSPWDRAWGKAGSSPGDRSTWGRVGTDRAQRRGTLRPPGWWWHSGGTAERAPRRKQVKVWHLLMDGLEELTLVFPNFGMVDLLHQLGVFVDEPRFPEYVGSSVFHLEGTRGRGWGGCGWRERMGTGPWGGSLPAWLAAYPS